MPYLADTNVAARWVLPADPEYTTIRRAIFMLQQQREVVYVTPQVMIESHALATRPLAGNGFGWAPATARSEARRIEAVFPMLQETSAIYPLWSSLMDAHPVAGRQAYDARLVAVMQVHGLSHILTFNGSHFRRYPGVTAVDPQTLVPLI